MVLEILSPELVAEPLKLTAKVKAPVLLTAIDAFEEVKAATACEP